MISAFFASMSSEAARDVKFRGCRFDHGAVHLHRLAFDGIPDHVLIFLGAVRKERIAIGRKFMLSGGVEVTML